MANSEANSRNLISVSPEAALLGVLSDQLSRERIAHETKVAEQQDFSEYVDDIEGLITGITLHKYDLEPGTSQLFDLLDREAMEERMFGLAPEARAVARSVYEPREVLLEAAYTQDDPQAFLRGVGKLIDQDSATAGWRQSVAEVDSVITSVLRDRTEQTFRYQADHVHIDGKDRVVQVRITPAEGMAADHARVLMDGFDPFDPDAVFETV